MFFVPLQIICMLVPRRLLYVFDVGFAVGFRLVSETVVACFSDLDQIVLVNYCGLNTSQNVPPALLFGTCFRLR